jgi:hypothetical protein
VTQEKLEQRALQFMDENFPIVGDDLVAFARAELQKAAEIADRYKEPLIAEEIRKLMD